MRVLLALALLMGTAGWVSSAQAACEDVKALGIADSFQITAGDLLTLSDLGLGAYVMGYTQGVFISVLAGSDKDCVDTLNLCTGDKTVGELAYQLRSYVAADPERLGQRASRVTFDAIFGACFAQAKP